MEEIVIKLDIAPELRERFELALAEVVKQFVKTLKLSLAKEIVSKSKLTEEQALELAKEVNKSLHKRYKKLYPELE